MRASGSARARVPTCLLPTHTRPTALTTHPPVQDILAYDAGATLTVEGAELGPGDIKVLRDFKLPEGSKQGGWVGGCAARADGRGGRCRRSCAVARANAQTSARTHTNFLRATAPPLAGELDAAGDGEVLVVLDLREEEGLLQAGLAREVVNRVQRLRKKAGLQAGDAGAAAGGVGRGSRGKQGAPGRAGVCRARLPNTTKRVHARAPALP